MKSGAKNALGILLICLMAAYVALLPQFYLVYQIGNHNTLGWSPRFCNGILMAMGILGTVYVVAYWGMRQATKVLDQVQHRVSSERLALGLAIWGLWFISARSIMAIVYATQGASADISRFIECRSRVSSLVFRYLKHHPCESVLAQLDAQCPQTSCLLHSLPIIDKLAMFSISEAPCGVFTLTHFGRYIGGATNHQVVAANRQFVEGFGIRLLYINMLYSIFSRVNLYVFSDIFEWLPFSEIHRRVIRRIAAFNQEYFGLTAGPQLSNSWDRKPKSTIALSVSVWCHFHRKPNLYLQRTTGILNQCLAL